MKLIFFRFELDEREVFIKERYGVQDKRNVIFNTYKTESL